MKNLCIMLYSGDISLQDEIAYFSIHSTAVVNHSHKYHVINITCSSLTSTHYYNLIFAFAKHSCSVIIAT